MDGGAPEPPGATLSSIGFAAAGVVGAAGWEVVGLAVGWDVVAEAAGAVGCATVVGAAGCDAVVGAAGFAGVVVVGLLQPAIARMAHNSKTIKK